MRLVSKYFWLQRRKSKREMAKSFYKQFDIPVNKKCLVALFPNTTEIQIRAGILGFLHYSALFPSTTQGPRSILMVLGSEVEGGRAWIVFRDLRVLFFSQTKRETTWPQICLSGWETHKSKERSSHGNWDHIPALVAPLDAFPLWAQRSGNQAGFLLLLKMSMLLWLQLRQLVLLKCPCLRMELVSCLG